MEPTDTGPLAAFRRPVHPETRQALGRAWQRVPRELRGPQQFLGRQYAGCGALIGAMPRCDFACRGCHLGEDANRIPPASLAEIAALIRRLRHDTGRELHAATTVTVTRCNLEGVADVIRWLVPNADAFEMVSFQPIAQVGRTEEGLGGAVSADEVWERIAEGLADHHPAGSALDEHTGWLGHPDCSRFVQGIVRKPSRGRASFVPLLARGDDRDAETVAGLLDRIGGLTFRLDPPLRALLRAAGVVAAHPRFLATRALPLLLRFGRRLAREGRMRLLWGRVRGREQLSYLNIVSRELRLLRGLLGAPARPADPGRGSVHAGGLGARAVARVAATLILATLGSAGAAAGADWREIHRADGVVVEVAEDREGGPRVRARGVLAATPAALRDVLLDLDAFPDWIDGLRPWRVLERSPGEARVAGCCLASGWSGSGGRRLPRRCGAWRAGPPWPGPPARKRGEGLRRAARAPRLRRSASS